MLLPCQGDSRMKKTHAFEIGDASSSKCSYTTLRLNMTQHLGGCLKGPGPLLQGI